MRISERSKNVRMTNEELLAALARLANRMGFSITEVDYMVRIVVQADHDPLPPADWGEPFEFTKRKVSICDDDDFDRINSEVPKSDAQVDLRFAWREFVRDVESIDRIYAKNPDLPLPNHWQVFVNQWDWLRFWSVRHPNPEARAKFERVLREADEAAVPITEKAQAGLSKRSVHPMPPLTSQ